MALFNKIVYEGGGSVENQNILPRCLWIPLRSDAFSLFTIAAASSLWHLERMWIDN